MKHYTETISPALAKKLKEKGMPMLSCFNITQTGSFSDDDGIHFYYIPSFGDCFDWLETEGVGIGIKHHWSGMVYQGYDWNVCQFHKTITPHFDTTYGTWHAAANATIEKALTLI